MLSLLDVFDSPTIVFNCVQRPASTMPLQSLSLLNSDFVVAPGRGILPSGWRDEAGAEPRRAWHARLSAGRCREQPTRAEAARGARVRRSAARSYYDGATTASTRAWTDFCQMLLASNAFLYVE